MIQKDGSGRGKMMHVHTQAGNVISIDPNRIKPFAQNPRKRFRGIEQLARSIVRAGQRQPVEVFALDNNEHFDYELIDGERRQRACIYAGINIREFVSPRPSKKAQFISSIAANFGREDHDVVERSDGVALLLAEGCTQVEVAEICGKTQTWVSQHFSLQKLHPKVRDLLLPVEDEEFRDEESGRKLRRKSPLSFQVALLLVPFDHKQQQELAKKVMGKSYDQARTIILGASSDAGIKTRARSIGGRKRTAALENALSKIAHVLDEYLDMQKDEFVRLFSQADPASIRRLAQSMCQNGMQLTQTSERLMRIIEPQLNTAKR